MNWWNVLEISYDSDIKEIKKAYAKLLKVHNPEDDAEGYQRLRKAYDEGIKYVKRRDKNKNNETESLDNSVETTSLLENEKYANKKIKFKADLYIDYDGNDKPGRSISLKDCVGEFLNILNTIYNNISLRRNSKEWEELLNMDVVWDAYSFQIIEDELFEFLIDNKHLPADIWLILKNNFNWDKDEIKLYHKYPANKVDSFFKNLRNPNKLKYNYLDELNSEIADEYLPIRQKAYEELEKKNYSSTQKYLLLAYDIFKHDPELLRLIGYFYYDNGHLAKALEFSREAFDTNDSDFDSSLLIGKILEESGRFNEALPYLEWYLSFNKDDELALNCIGYCYYYTNDLLRAKESFQKSLGLRYDNKTIQKYLKNIELRLEGKNNRIIKFKKYKPKKKKIIQNEWKRQETKKMKKSLISAGVIFLIFIFMFFSNILYSLFMFIIKLI